MKVQKESGAVPDITDVLKRYTEIQISEQELRREKAGLQKLIASHMAVAGRKRWGPEVAGQKLRVLLRETVAFEYDEMLLRNRLGERYHSILEPDIRKLRKCIDDAAPLLRPLMARIGSPSQDRIREAVRGGTVSQEEFAGTFEKTVKNRVTVMRVRG